MEEHLSSPAAALADVGTYRYTTGSGKSSTTHRWQFAAIRLPESLPHLLLDAKANDALFGSNLPVAFGRSQRVDLGGPFAEHFDLYAPDGYGADALYVLTPDLMAHLIDETAALDVEIIDDWMFLFTRQDLPVTDPATWHRLARISDTVAVRIRDRSQTYRDHRSGEAIEAADRAPAPGPGGARVTGPRAVVPAGRRLTRRQFWLPAAIMVVVVIGVVQLGPALLSFLITLLP